MAERANGRMFDLTAASDPAAEPPWIYWWSPARAHSHAGRVALLTGQAHLAERHFEDAIAGLDPHDYAIDRTRYLTFLAIARLHLGEVEGACHTATEAATVTRDLNSDRLRTSLRDFRRTAQPHANSTAVTTFDTHTADLLHPTAS